MRFRSRAYSFRRRVSVKRDPLRSAGEYVADVIEGARDGRARRGERWILFGFDYQPPSVTVVANEAGDRTESTMPSPGTVNMPLRTPALDR